MQITFPQLLITHHLWYILCFFSLHSKSPCRVAAVTVAAVQHGREQSYTSKRESWCVSRDVASMVTQHGRVTAPNATRSILHVHSSARLSSIPHLPLESKIYIFSFFCFLYFASLLLSYFCPLLVIHIFKSGYADFSFPSLFLLFFQISLLTVQNDLTSEIHSSLKISCQIRNHQIWGKLWIGKICKRLVSPESSCTFSLSL